MVAAKWMTIELKSTQFDVGDTITGKVNLELEEPLRLESLTVHCSGTTELKFVRSNGRRCNQRKSCLNVSTVLVDHKTPIFGKRGDPLDEGSHSFPFSIQLPEEIPGSFNGECGSIAYTIWAVLQKGWSPFRETSEKTQIKILEKPQMRLALSSSKETPLQPIRPSSNLSRDTKSLDSVCSLMEKKTFCVGVNYGKLRLLLQTKAYAYRPGEVIRLNLNLENDSKSVVTEMAVGLVETVVYQSGKVALNCRSVCCGEISPKEVAPGGKTEWSGIVLTIPPTVNLDICQSNQIQVMHALVVNICPMTSSNVKITQPINIFA